MDLGAGSNRVSLNQAHAPVFGGVVQVNVTGGVGPDTLSATLDGPWTGNSRFGVDTSSSTAAPRRDVLVSGGPGNDLLTFDQTAAAGGILAGVSIVDEGFGSVDRCTAGGGTPPHKRGCEL